MPTLEKLQENRLISVVESGNDLIGYRFLGVLYDIYEALDATLLKIMAHHVPATSHSCTTLIERAALEKIGFFDKLPCIPMAASPHAAADENAASTQDSWILSPSTCYHTFSHLAGSSENWDLKCFTAIGHCHRFEPVLDEPTRLGSFTMREFVLLGKPHEIEQKCEVLFQSGVAFIRRLVPSAYVARASDVFYGESAGVTRKVQLAMGVKLEVLIPWTERDVSVGSRNLHRNLFTTAFKIGSQEQGAVMHSACVAFGMERLLLSLLTQIDDPVLLLSHLRNVLADDRDDVDEQEDSRVALV
jgi:hypothetical protein